jgi:hypothetical protein
MSCFQAYEEITMMKGIYRKRTEILSDEGMDRYLLCLFIKDIRSDEIKGILKVYNELEEEKAIEEKK